MSRRSPRPSPHAYAAAAIAHSKKIFYPPMSSPDRRARDSKDVDKVAAMFSFYS